MNNKEIQDWLIAQIADQMELDPNDININEPLVNYGLTSRDAVTLSGDLEELLGRKLSPTLVYEFPNIHSLAHYLSSSNASKEDSTSDVTDIRGNSLEPIAIVGMACRFPQANSLDEYWELLVNGTDGITEIPRDRWKKDLIYHPDPSIPGKSVSMWGGFLSDIDKFDPFFFGISPAEAKEMDPQQRLLMELSYEALDHAGLIPEQLDGSNTGVFIGVSVNEYSQLQRDNLAKISSHSGTGTALSIVANRISYYYNFKGPSLVIDTACSSSLSAVHLACQSLRNRECNLALAGGVNIILSPGHSVAFTKAGVLAPDGKCKTFDASANGYVRGEGAGLVALKPLSLARKDGNQILAIIKGSAMAQDGRTNGLMAPNKESQEELLKKAYFSANISPAKVQYVETHGTGTLLGDSMEAAALGAIVGSGDRSVSCAIGSVKTNIGHLEAAAGIAGLIKVVLSIQKKTLPPILHFQTPNPHIDFEKLKLKVQNVLKPWKTQGEPLTAGVSSFGFGGTNVHLVLQEDNNVKEVPFQKSEVVEENYEILAFSANSKEGLFSLARGFKEKLSEKNDYLLRDICFAAAERRGKFNYRLALLCKSKLEAIELIDDFLIDEQNPNLVFTGSVTNRTRKIAFIFSGQGGQWFGMGKELMSQEYEFLNTIIQIDEIIRQNYFWSLKEEFLDALSQESIEDIAKVQPAIFAIQIALANLLKYWGILPDAVLGHSLGETAAAYVAGYLNLEDAVKVICERSLLLKTISGKGGMLATELSFSEAENLIKGLEEKVSIAAINGPNSLVFSGDLKELGLIKQKLDSENLYCKWVKVDVASHSAQIDEISPDLLKNLSNIKPANGQITFYSTVTGTLGYGVNLDAKYWVENIRKPVLFSQAAKELISDGHTILIEVGPHPLLLGSLRQLIFSEQDEFELLPTMRREEPERFNLLKILASCYTKGVAINWGNINQGPKLNIPLPAIPWEKERYWIETGPEPRIASWYPTEEKFENYHPLLGKQIDLAANPSMKIWQKSLIPESLPYLMEHVIMGEMVFPATAYIEISRAALNEIGAKGSYIFKDLAFLKKRVIEEGVVLEVQTFLTNEAENRYELSVYFKDNHKELWEKYFSMKVIFESKKIDFDQTVRLFPKNEPDIQKEEFYPALKTLGLQYGEAYQGLEGLWFQGHEVIGKIEIPNSLKYDLDKYILHPALLDSCLHGIAGFYKQTEGNQIYLPVGCDEIYFFNQNLIPGWITVSLDDQENSNPEISKVDVVLFSPEGEIIGEIIGLLLQKVSKVNSQEFKRSDTWLYQLEWKKLNSFPKSKDLEINPKSWLILSDNSGLGAELSMLFKTRGDKVYVWDLVDFIEGGLDSLRIKIEKNLNEIPDSLSGIIHLWSIDIQNLDQNNSIKPEFLGCQSTLILIQALAARFANSPKLWLVTKGGYSILPGEMVAVEQTPLWGLGKTISFELAEFKCVRIDFSLNDQVSEIKTHLYNQIFLEDKEDQIAFRNGSRFGHRLLPLQKKLLKKDFSLKADKSYLITGGLGGLGLETADWMIGKGANYIILVGRKKPSKPVLDRIEQMNKNGVKVFVSQTDVVEPDQVQKLFKWIDKEMPELIGIVHSAGLLEDSAILNLDMDKFKSVMAPKVNGTWNLHRASLKNKLDFFVMYSSAVSVLGSPGQANYSAASSYLDGMAYYRHQLNLPALSINWGPWAEVGLAAKTTAKLKEQNLSTQHLVKVIEISQGFETLEFLLSNNIQQVLVLPFNLKDLLELYPAAAKMTFFEEVGGRDIHVAKQYARPNLRQDFVAPRTDVERKIADIWQQTLHIDRVGVSDSFFELGGDSVLASQILALVRKTYGISISPQDAFLEFTIEKLASLLEENILKQIEEMSEEEVKRRLN